MSQTGYTPILLYATATASTVPTAANLTSTPTGAELAINYTDGKLYYKDNTGTVQLLASKAVASISLPLSAANGGTGVGSLTGLAYGNGTSAFTAATAAQIVSAIGSTAVTNATNATTATTATTAANGGVTSVNSNTGAVTVPIPATTWHNVASSRALGTTYTNSYSYPIIANVATYGGSSTSSAFYVGGVQVGAVSTAANTNFNQTVTMWIPPGATYQVTTSGQSITIWAELY